MKTLEYPMIAITITKKQCDYIMSPILLNSLPKSGIVRMFPRDVVYAPLQYLGLGMIHPWDNQNLTQIIVCLKETKTESMTGDLIKATMEQIRLECGLVNRFCLKDLDILQDVGTNCWLRDLFMYLKINKMVMHDDLPLLEPFRSNDKSIIESFVLNGFKRIELKMLNECRMFFQVIFLSEITTADGLMIEGWAWRGFKYALKINHYTWPRSPKQLSSNHWNLWQRALKVTFLTHLGESERTLRVAMGNWKGSVKHRWRWFYSEKDDRIYIKNH